MASIHKRGSVWRAEVFKHNIRKSASFATKAEATAWATQIEAEIASGKRGNIPSDKTFGDILKRYQTEVSTTKRGERWESIRIQRMVIGNDKLPPDPICAVLLSNLSSSDFSAWRDRKLRQISPESVRREWNLLSHACTIAAREWGWLKENPMKTVRRPAPSAPRDRRISDKEIDRLMFAAGYDYENPPQTMTARVGVAFLFAIETGMRIGEICGLDWHNVHIEKRFLKITGEKLGAGKTFSAKRDVPLSGEAIRILNQLAEVKDDTDSVFQLTTPSTDAIFRKLKSRCMIEDLHFHDTRHEAITRLAKKLDVLDLARMVGHRDIKQLMVYYNETASEMALKLD